MSVFDHLYAMLQASTAPGVGERRCKRTPPWHWMRRFARHQRRCGRPRRMAGVLRAPRPSR